jgi:G8 domain/IPT/TIG domain
VIPSNAIDAVVYSNQVTPVVNTVTPRFGPSYGNTVVNIVGQRLSGVVSVLVDGVPCKVSSSNDTNIVCRSGNRDIAAYRTPTSKFEVKVNGNNAALFQNFFYANKFSDEATWGGDIPPREMDSIAVPAGETLIVDIIPPRLFAIIVEG